MGWSALLFCAAVVLCPVLSDESVFDKTHGVLDFSQLSALHHGSSHGLQHFLHSPYANHFTNFEQKDNKDKDVHQNVKTIIVTKKVPVPYTVQVERKVPYAVKVPVRRPYAIYVPKPYLVEIPKPVPYAVKVPVPQPYTVEKHVPFPYRVPVDKPFPVQVPKPYPVIVERKVPVPVEKPIPFQVKVPIEKPVPVPVPIEKHIPYTVEKPIPVPFHVKDDKHFTFTLDHQNTFPGHFDSNSEHAQLAPYYAEYFQKHFSGQNQAVAETQNKGFQSSPEDPTASTVADQHSKVLSFLPGSSSQEHVSYYYPNHITSHDDVLTSNSNHQYQKVPTTQPIGPPWPKQLTGDWTPKRPTTFKVMATQNPPPVPTYSIGDGKTLYKFSLEKNPEPLSQASHTFVTESVKGKPSQQNFFLNQLLDNAPSKGENHNPNKKKTLYSDKIVTGNDGMKSVYFDMSKQKSPFINYELPHNQMTAGQKYTFINHPSYEKFDFSKAQTISNNFNIPKSSQQQVVEQFDFSNAQQLLQLQNPTQSTPYFQSLQQLHSYNPYHQNFSSAYQYAYPYQKINSNNMFSLSQYPNLYSNKHSYAYLLPEGSKQHTSKNKEKTEKKEGAVAYSSYRFENSIKTHKEQPEEEVDVITYSPVILVNSELPDINYQNQVTTPKAVVYDISPKVHNLMQEEHSSVSQQTTSHPIKEIYPSIQIDSVQGSDSSIQFKTFQEESHPHVQDIQIPVTRIATRADSIFGSATPPTVEKVKERRKDRRRSNSGVKHHRKTSFNEDSTVRVVTSTADPTTQHTTVSQVTQPSVLNLKPQVPNPLDHQKYQTTSPEPEQVSRVEINKTFGHTLPIRMAYSINGDNHYKRTQELKRREEKAKNAENKVEKDSRSRENFRRRNVRKPESPTESPKTTHTVTNMASTTASTVRTRGTRRSNRQRTDVSGNTKSEVTTTKIEGEPSSTKNDEIAFETDMMRIQTSSKVHHTNKDEPDSTPATSFTDITRTFPKKSRRRNMRKHNYNANSTTTASTNSSPPNYPSLATPTANYPSSSYNATANYLSTVTYSSPPNNSSANYPSTSNYPLTNQPTPFQMTPSFTATSMIISTPNNPPQTISQELISSNSV